jgi:hypothetical protein
MLNQTICRKCINTHRKQLPAVRGMSWEPMPWTSDDELFWENQVVGCPRDPSGEIELTLFDLTKDKCHYRLEHLMTQGLTTC